MCFLVSKRADKYKKLRVVDKKIKTKQKNNKGFLFSSTVFKMYKSHCEGFMKYKLEPINYLNFIIFSTEIRFNYKYPHTSHNPILGSIFIRISCYII